MALRPALHRVRGRALLAMAGPRAGGYTRVKSPPPWPSQVLPMSDDVTRILSALEQGDPSAAQQLLPLVYDELLKLAAVKLAQEKPGQTLQATVLVHEAYVRLVDVEQAQHWNSRGHFFAAAEAASSRRPRRGSRSTSRR